MSSKAAVLVLIKIMIVTIHSKKFSIEIGRKVVENYRILILN